MKKMIAAVVVAMVVALIGAGAAIAGVSGSKHDIAGYLWTSATISFLGANGTNQADAEICVYCHTPHAANTSVKALLWNKTNTTITVYTPYTMVSASLGNQTITGTTGNITKLCLSCHDGGQAVYAMGNTPNYYGFIVATTGRGNISAAGLMSGSPLLDSDFSNDHPIDFKYSTAAAVTGNQLNTSPGTTAPMDNNGNMVCSTCHDVHNSAGITDSALLRMSNKGSALCRYCHLNK